MYEEEPQFNSAMCLGSQKHLPKAISLPSSLGLYSRHYGMNCNHQNVRGRNAENI